MNDITKARIYFNKRGSKLQHLESFGLMYLTAENEYKDIRRVAAQKDARLPGDFDEKEVEAALDYSVMVFMRKYNTLPPNVATVFQAGLSKEEKLELARQWAGA